MSSLRPPVIWVLEDEVSRLADLCELLALVYPGATISPYSEARTLEFATTFRSAPDLLISDLRMEGADGFGAIQSVEKFREKYPDTHIVINSGFAYHVQPRWALDSHFTFVPKGDPDDLLQTVNSILAAQGLQQAVSIRREADGSPAYADAPRLSRGWMAAGFGAVSAAWTATILSVTSTMSKSLTVTALVMALLGGVMLGFGRSANKTRLALYFGGSVLILFAAFAMPLFMNVSAASP